MIEINIRLRQIRFVQNLCVSVKTNQSIWSKSYMDNWDIRYLKLAEQVATWSKDPSSKIGAYSSWPKRRSA